MSLGRLLGRWLTAPSRVERLGRWLAAYARLVWKKGRWEVIGQARAAEFWETGQPVIIAFWHGRLFLLPFAWATARPVAALVSSHQDGAVVSALLRELGVDSIRGSTNRGGASALRAMVRAARSGVSIAMAPDGPRGPRMRASDGIVALSRLVDAPILPVAISVERGRFFGSWDRFMLPLVGGRGTVIWGEAVQPAASADPAALEAVRRRLEDSLIALTRQADERCGRVPVEPELAEPDIARA